MTLTAAGRTREQYLDDVDTMVKSEAARLNCGSFVKATFEANYQAALARVLQDLPPEALAFALLFSDERDMLCGWLSYQSFGVLPILSQMDPAPWGDSTGGE